MLPLPGERCRDRKSLYLRILSNNFLFSGAITSQLDKASIVRLTIAYLRLREFAAHGDPPWNRDGRFDGKPTLKGETIHSVSKSMNDIL